MGTRTIHECDRCNREVRGDSDLTRIAIGGEGRGIARTVEVCGSCLSKLDLFLSGRELDEPP